VPATHRLERRNAENPRSARKRETAAPRTSAARTSFADTAPNGRPGRDARRQERMPSARTRTTQPRGPASTPDGARRRRGQPVRPPPRGSAGPCGAQRCRKAQHVALAAGQPRTRRRSVFGTAGKRGVTPFRDTTTRRHRRRSILPCTIGLLRHVALDRHCTVASSEGPAEENRGYSRVSAVHSSGKRTQVRSCTVKSSARQARRTKSWGRGPRRRPAGEPLDGRAGRPGKKPRPRAAAWAAIGQASEVDDGGRGCPAQVTRRKYTKGEK